MPKTHNLVTKPLVGLIGFGAFGRLIARHLEPHLTLCAYDPILPLGPHFEARNVTITKIDAAASCPVVILATPVSALEAAINSICPYLIPGSLILDVGSVKMIPVEIMLSGLPEYVDILATHPLFGPQSACDGIDGLKIAICPVRGKQGFRVAAFLRKVLRLDVIMTTAEIHDRDAAMVQGLTHLIAKVLVQMEPLPSRITTRSFDLLIKGVNMVRHDAPEVFNAIEQSNPYALEVRRRFFDLASILDAELMLGSTESRKQDGRV